MITAVLALGARQMGFATGQDSYLNPDSQTAIDDVEFQDNFSGGVLAEGGTKIESDPVKWIGQGSQTAADIDQLEESTGFGTTLVNTMAKVISIDGATEIAPTSACLRTSRQIAPTSSTQR